MSLDARYWLGTAGNTRNYFRSIANAPLTRHRLYSAPVSAQKRCSSEFAPTVVQPRTALGPRTSHGEPASLAYLPRAACLGVASLADAVPCTLPAVGESAYSFSLTTFSPSGKLVQIEYALNAVSSGSTSLGIKGARSPRGGSGFGALHQRCRLQRRRLSPFVPCAPQRRTVW